jgi:hypothetical protein
MLDTERIAEPHSSWMRPHKNNGTRTAMAVNASAWFGTSLHVSATIAAIAPTSASVHSVHTSTDSPSNTPRPIREPFASTVLSFDAAAERSRLGY